MNPAKKLGHNMAVVSICAFTVYTLCFLVILLINPPFAWTGLTYFVRYTRSYPQAFKYIGMLCMLLFGIAYTVLALCERNALALEKRLYGGIAAAFALAFCICIGSNYFIQLTATRLQIEQEVAAVGLEQFTQSFPISVLNAVNMLGWTVFYGISSLALYFAYHNVAGAKALRFFCLANSMLMFLGAVGYAFQFYLVLVICMNPGLGITTLGMMICMARKNRV